MLASVNYINGVILKCLYITDVATFSIYVITCFIDCVFSQRPDVTDDVPTGIIL
jgi:hypothetical protein